MFFFVVDILIVAVVFVAVAFVSVTIVAVVFDLLVPLLAGDGVLLGVVS